jgi:methyl-accepting chemotaxis protein
MIYLLVPQKEVNAEAKASIIKFAILFVIGFAGVLVISFFIGRSMARPLAALAGFMNKAGKTGNINLGQKDIEAINEFSKIKDEIGQSIESAFVFIKRMNQISEQLETIANNDLTAEIDVLSEKDVMGNSLRHMEVQLNEMFREINTASGQVDAGARQVADGAQILAQGAAEQSASIEELSSAIASIAEMTKENTEMASRAANLSETVKGSAEKGSAHMDEMVRAVREIDEASQSISKVIKTIDDIAFQTNILALNAAVEAARAGQHGKGFAVVAEEVRNLASKSAEAAKDTGNLIANSIEKAGLGVRIAGETTANFAEIVSGISESNELIVKIAGLSEKQSDGISQINIGIGQVANVVQQNSATAEESAAASEQISGRSATLKQLISQFKLK